MAQTHLPYAFSRLALPLGSLPLIVALSIASWVAVIGVIYLGRRLASWLVGI